MKKAFMVLFVLGFTFAAKAHVSLETPTAAAGSYYKAVVRIPHGCDGTATTGVQVEIPAGFILPKPMPKAGWNIELVKDSQDQVQQVRFTGGKLQDAFYDEFVFRGKIAAAAGTTLYFKVLQTCEKGQTYWADIPAAGQDEHELPAPAASLKVTAASTGH